MQLTPIKKTFTYGAHPVTLETGEMARQAHGAVVVNMDDSVVLCTVVGARQAKTGQDFLPLNGDYALNPTATQLKESRLNLVVAGTEHAVLMVESEASELPEDVMLGSVVFGHQQMQAAIKAVNDLADEAAKPAWDWKPAAKDE